MGKATRECLADERVSLFERRRANSTWQQGNRDDFRSSEAGLSVRRLLPRRQL